MKSIFASIGLSLSTSVFVFIVGIMYYIKNKNSKTKITNKTFIIMLLLTTIIGVTELVTTVSLSRTSEPTLINNIMCRGMVFMGFVWNLLYLVYIRKLTKESQNKDSSLKTIDWIIVILSCVAALVGICFIPVEYTSGLNDTPFVITGGLLAFLTIDSIIVNIVSLTYFAIFKEKIRNFYLTPVVAMNTLNIIFCIATLFTNTFINYQLAFFAITIVLLYLTVESQDSKLVAEYTKSKEEALIANKAKTEFLINMSHEIRTPMNTILGFGESLLHEPALTEEIARRDIKNISEASSTLLDLINNILDISKLEAGEVTLTNNDYLLESLIFELNSLIPSKITKEELRFTIDINNDIPKEYNGDAYKIFKIVSYILLNAIEYTNYGEVKLTIDGKKLENNDFELLFLVSNTGHAMTDEIFNRGFEDFVKIENASQNNVDGIKLGIIIAKQLIQMLGGTIEFINRKGEGTKYYVRLTQKIVNEEKIGNIFESREGQVSSSRDIMNCAGMKALVVDDSEINVKLASRYMQQFNFTVSTALNGKDCIELVRTNDFDIILIDHMMPEMDGVETVKVLQTLGKELPPIVALTANNYDGIKEDFIRKGFANYIQKPLNFKELSKVINNTFRKDN